MTPRGLIGLAALTIVAFIGAIIILIVEQSSVRADVQSGQVMFPALAERQDEISQVTIETSRYQIVLEKRGDGWVSIDRGDYPVLAQPLDETIRGVAELTTLLTKTSNAELYPDIGVAGITPGSESIHFRAVAANGDVLADTILGNVSVSIGNTPRGGLFVRNVNEAQSWLVEGTVLPPTFLDRWFSPLFNIRGPDINRVRFFRGDQLQFDAEKVNVQTGDYELRFIDPAVDARTNLIANDSPIRTFQAVVLTLPFTDARTRDGIVVPADARIIEIQTVQGVTLRITLIPIDGVTWVTFDATAAAGSAGEPIAAQIQATTANWAFTLDPSRMITLNRNITEFVTVPARANPLLPGIGGTTPGLPTGNAPTLPGGLPALP